MPNDINEALRALMDAARGRAFLWDNPAQPGRGWRAISRIDIDTSMDDVGVTRFYVTAGSTDYANVLLTGMAGTLVDAVIAAHSALSALPLAADVPLYSAPAQPGLSGAANDALMDPLNLAAAFGPTPTAGVA